MHFLFYFNTCISLYWFILSAFLPCVNFRNWTQVSRLKEQVFSPLPVFPGPMNHFYNSWPTAFFRRDSLDVSESHACPFYSNLWVNVLKTTLAWNSGDLSSRSICGMVLDHRWDFLPVVTQKAQRGDHMGYHGTDLPSSKHLYTTLLNHPLARSLIIPFHSWR